MTIKLLEPGVGAVAAMSRMLTRPHVFRVLTATWQSLTGLYILLRSVEFGQVRVLAALDDHGTVVATCWGEPLPDGGWENHSAFERGVDATAISLKMADVLKEQLGTKYIIGKIPVENRAARRYARHFGSVETGRETHAGLTGPVELVIYRKEL